MDIEYKSRIELLGHTFVVFDLETTGLFFEYFDEPIEIGAVKLDINLNIVDKLHLYIMPKKKITKKITEITGLTEEIISKNNPVTTKEGITRLRQFIGNSIPVGHNSKFDITFTNYWLDKFNLQLLGDYICTEKTFRYNYKEDFAPSVGRFKTNLTAMGDILGVVNKQAHSAIEDTIATAKCFKIMFEKNDKIALIKLSKKDAFTEVRARVIKSRIYSKVLADMTTTSPINIPADISSDIESKIVYELNKTNKTPEEISKALNIPRGTVYRAIINWINIPKLKKYSYIFWKDKRSPLFIKDILEFANWDINEAYGMMKYITPFPPNKLDFEVVLKLYGNENVIDETKIDDLEDYFINYQPLRVIEDAAGIDELTAVRYLADWLKTHKEYLNLWIQALGDKHLLTQNEYQRMIKYRENSEEKYQKWYSELSEENLRRIENTNLFLKYKFLDY